MSDVVSLAHTTPQAPLGRDLKICAATVQEFQKALPLANDERIQTHFQPVLEQAQAVLTTHIARPFPSVADDLAALNSLVSRFRIEADADFGRNINLRQLRGLQLTLIGDIDQAISSAAALGLVVTTPVVRLPDAAMLERAGREGQLLALGQRLNEIEKKLDAVIAPEAEGNVSLQQKGLVNFYVNSMKIELSLARIETTIKELVDLSSLGRAIEKTADLTERFVETVKGATTHMSDTLKKAAPVIGKVARRGVKGFRTLVGAVLKRERAEPQSVDPTKPPADFDMDEVHAMILRREAPPARWVPWIMEIYLSDSLITDLESIEGLTALQMLDLERTQVTDLEPIRGLTALQTLDLSNTQITDLEPIRGLRALQTLSLGGTPVSDLEPIRALTALQALNLIGTPVSDLEPIRALTALLSLDLDFTDVADLEPIKGLTALQTLYIMNTKITDLEPIRGLTKLEDIFVEPGRVHKLRHSLGRNGIVKTPHWLYPPRKRRTRKPKA
jgi:hypothetical protein